MEEAGGNNRIWSKQEGLMRMKEYAFEEVAKED
jgi:hypothetical protein